MEQKASFVVYRSTTLHRGRGMTIAHCLLRSAIAGVIFVNELRAAGRPFAFSPMWVLLACLCSAVLARLDVGALLRALRRSDTAAQRLARASAFREGVHAACAGSGGGLRLDAIVEALRASTANLAATAGRKAMLGAADVGSLHISLALTCCVSATVPSNWLEQVCVTLQASSNPEADLWPLVTVLSHRAG
jgi:hypothetical protein